MNKLISVLERLYFLQGQQWSCLTQDADGALACLAKGRLTPEVMARGLAGEADIALDLVSSDGMARAMIIAFKRVGDWAMVAKLFQAVQDELDLPTPALAISACAGYQVWFSLAEPVPVAQARIFLNALQLRYLADLPAAYLEFLPDLSKSPVIKLVPALDKASNKWSAFIDPSMGSMFVDGPGLEMVPNLDRQADMLAGLKCIKAGDFERVLAHFQAVAERDTELTELALRHAEVAAVAAAPEAGDGRAMLNVGGGFQHPCCFLLAVMNDVSASAHHRIDAAKALLPYFGEKCRYGAARSHDCRHPA